MTQAADVRASHRFDEAALAAYLSRHQAGFVGPMSVRQFDGGQSNPTYLIEAQSGRYVLRKQPPGELLPSAHQVDREYLVAAALEGTGVPVAPMRCLCTDASVIGSSFYVMDYVPGRIFEDASLPGLQPAERRALYLDLVRVLGELHRLDPDAIGLGDYGRAGNYFSRQISRWSRQYEASATEEIDAMSRLMRWLPEHVPHSTGRSIVHGDFRVGNCMVDPATSRVAAVLDWELSTLGDPLADLGFLCQMYYIEDAQFGVAAVNARELGIPDQATLVAEYCRHAGQEHVEGLSFSIIYNLFRLAALTQGVYRRGLDGNASSTRAVRYRDAARTYSDTAWRLVERRDAPFR